MKVKLLNPLHIAEVDGKLLRFSDDRRSIIFDDATVFTLPEDAKPFRLCNYAYSETVSNKEVEDVMGTKYPKGSLLLMDEAENYYYSTDAKNWYLSTTK